MKKQTLQELKGIFSVTELSFFAQLLVLCMEMKNFHVQKTEDLIFL